MDNFHFNSCLGKICGADEGHGGQNGVSGDALERSRVPALKMKLWYVSELELPETGKVMEGATLVSIRPVEGWEAAESGGDRVLEALDLDRWVEEARGFGEAARIMVKRKKTCTLEMSSF
ncbi:unnamed protein product [Ilex paraguariensis]|uniref:Uncharacterized protein n=1 Tax=Ilex paraguariensis TaxID=185542 RepID=A0ABC8UTP5_9AQUA